MTDERRILLGRVLGAFGVRGELKIQSYTDPEKRAAALPAVDAVAVGQRA
jgi:ribosomal 30S subunit maturation factor RimM